MAHTLGSASLLHTVDVAFVHGLDVMLWCCAGIALAAALLALAFLPRSAGAPAETAGPAGDRRPARPVRPLRHPTRRGHNDHHERSAGPRARPVGLRERKKARTRAAIREHALRLFREQGYHATTVEQIAEAAEISPSTFFRYFPTKEDVVLQDDFDLITLEAFERSPPSMSVIAAFRAAVAEVRAALTEEELARFGEIYGADADDTRTAGPDGRRAQPGRST